ncbi:hypothetical protein LUX12_10285 [Streptomyces somaliensis]|nr:hypothetical protein [Streptomyces somaliensis]MCP9945082.1 hypothetical protein [Streptomyces somaliensis]
MQVVKEEGEPGLFPVEGYMLLPAPGVSPLSALGAFVWPARTILGAFV